MRHAAWLATLLLIAQVPDTAPTSGPAPVAKGEAEPAPPSPVPHARGFVPARDWDKEIRKANAAPDAARLRAEIQAAAEAPLPASFVYQYATAVKNQGPYGNCWGFAGCAVVEGKLVEASKGSGPAPDLSEQYVINHNTDGFGCNGGDVPFEFLRTVGTATEADCPYRGCASADSAKVTYKIKSWAYVADDSSVPDPVTLKSAILAHGPLCVAVGAGAEWDSYQPGQVIAGGVGINHMVALYGWDDARQAWLVRNSWGAGWGDKGYCWVRYGAGRIGTGAAFCSVTDPPAPTPGPAPTPDPGPAEFVPVSPVWVPWNGSVVGFVRVKASTKDRVLILTPPAGGK